MHIPKCHCMPVSITLHVIFRTIKLQSKTNKTTFILWSFFNHIDSRSSTITKTKTHTETAWLYVQYMYHSHDPLKCLYYEPSCKEAFFLYLTIYFHAIPARVAVLISGQFQNINMYFPWTNLHLNFTLLVHVVVFVSGLKQKWIVTWVALTNNKWNRKKKINHSKKKSQFRITLICFSLEVVCYLWIFISLFSIPGFILTGDYLVYHLLPWPHELTYRSIVFVLTGIQCQHSKHNLEVLDRWIDRYNYFKTKTNPISSIAL